MDVNSRDPLQNIIPFRIKGVEIGRFDSSGNLKIGTTTTTAPTVRLDISGGSARVNSGSAASTALTTVGRIGVNTAAPGADLDVSGVARLSASSATATALTTTGRIGVNMAAPTVDLDVSGVARLSASTATATALTTTGRIGVNMTTPTVDLDVSGAARLTASTATATALTTTGRIGVNMTTPTVDLEVNGLAKLGNVNIVPLYVFTTHTFTNAGVTGRLGPTLDNVRTAYSGVSWAQNNSYLSMTNDNGIQLWTVPLSGNYTIRAKGAAGLDTRGGKGRDIQLTTTLIKGEVIRILVGQQGTGDGNFSSGGGGTFVVRGTDTPIIVAGGGGGMSNLMTYPNQEPFSDASITTSGKTTPYGYAGGSNGGGGFSGAEGGNSGQPAGGGFYGNGAGSGGGGSGGGFSFTAGGFGGQGYNNGGFGGGGGWFNYPSGAGGGGYSGGGAGGKISGIPNGVYFTSDNLGGGGGGSFGITTLTDFGATNTGHGSVIITLTTPSVALEVIGVAVVTGSSATATAMTTVGRIGVNTAAPTTDLDVVGAARLTASSATATALTTTGRIGVNTPTPTVDLDVVGAARLTASTATATALTTTGRIGINVAAPTVDLDVSGVARLTASTATATALTTTGRIGVNMLTPTVDFEVNGLAKIGNVNIGANPLYAFTSHTFTNAGATGRTGPALSTVRTTYTNAGATWAATNLNMTTNGIQLWTVPVTGTYTIRAKGAAGFIGSGLSNARGIDIQTTTTLIKGEVIKILVGQRGSAQGLYANMGSGGGGSFVVRAISTPIIIAGGGGGTGGSSNSYVNSDASRETYGMNGSANIDSYGTNGGGGKGGQGSGGGGFLQDGFAGINNNIPPSSFLTGGVGGLATGGSGVGGFGGGGYAHDTTAYYTGGGGGGGYSGGGGGLDNDPGGGGGSFAISTITVNGYNTDHGSVTITLLSTSSDFDISGVARVSASSATATALTTVGRIGVNMPDPMADLDVLGAARLTASTATATALTTTGRIGVNMLTPTVDLDVSGAARLSASSATATALTTTGRIGVNMATPTTTLDVNGIMRSNTGIKLGNAATTAMTGNSILDVENTGTARARFTSGTNILTVGTHSNTTNPSESFFVNESNTPMIFGTNNNERMRILADGKVGIGTTVPTVALDVSGNARVTGSMTINSCTPRSSVTYASNLRTNYSIPVALRGGNFITNKVYFSIRVLAGNRPLYLKPNGSASTFHSFLQQTAGTSATISGFDEAPGFKMCEIMGSAYSSGYTPPSFTHIVGEFTIIRNTSGHTSTISSVTGITTRIYGTLVQYGNHYMQKWDFQGQAVQGAADDSYDRIDHFQFLTSDTTKDADTGNSVAVTIEG